MRRVGFLWTVYRAWVLASLCVAALPLAAARGQAAEEMVTVESLLRQMTDLRWLAEPPRAGERTIQFSSYDRATRLEGGKIIHMFANGDVGHYLRVEGEGERREWVLAEAKGPGYVSRIWSANPDGELRIYIDGNPAPALAAPFAAITNGEIAPFTAPFGHDASRGRNLYFPFPFAKSIKISTTKGKQYFQVSVTTFPNRTKVESYAPPVLQRAAAAIEQARQELLQPRFDRPGDEIERKDLELAPGQGADLVHRDGAGDRGGAITSLACKVDASNLDEALARTLLTITFDQAERPQVAVPLGDFFGSGPGVNPFHSLVHRVGDDGRMAARWYMPFRRSVRVRLTNTSGQPVRIHGEAAFDRTPPPENALYFHARWRLQDDLQTKKADGTLDWPSLRVSQAQGRFVGLLLNIHNPTPAWWGEGDEKIYVDDEPFPSTFGTGTEDYFGYAWGDSRPYMNPFHAQTRCDGPGSKGNSSNIRYQILDSVPFSRSLSFDIEVWHWERVRIQFATLAYLYAGPGAVIEPGAPDLEDRRVHLKPPVKREPGAIEAESLKVARKSAGEVPNQDMAPFGDAWSGSRQLWWFVHESGATLDLELPVKTAGAYIVSAAFTRAGDYGIVQLSIDGKPLGAPIDLYEPFPRVVHTGGVELGRATLDAGPHTLSLKLTGKNPGSSNYLVGMDWIKLAPAAPGALPETKLPRR